MVAQQQRYDQPGHRQRHAYDSHADGQRPRVVRSRHHLRRRCFARRQRLSQWVTPGQHACEGYRRRRALCRIGIKAARDHAFNRRIQIFHHAHGAGNCAAIGSLEGALAGEDFVQHQAQRVDVAALGDFVAGQLLRCHVGRGAVADLRAVQLIGQRGQAEVHDQHLATPVDHDVGRLKIAMQNAFGMRGCQARAKLARDLHGLVIRQPADAAQQAGEVFAVDIFHRDERRTIHLANIVDAADVGV